MQYEISECLCFVGTKWHQEYQFEKYLEIRDVDLRCRFEQKSVLACTMGDVPIFNERQLIPRTRRKAT
jgi:hypothetical protein